MQPEIANSYQQWVGERRRGCGALATSTHDTCASQFQISGFPVVVPTPCNIFGAPSRSSVDRFSIRMWRVRTSCCSIISLCGKRIMERVVSISPLMVPLKRHSQALLHSKPAHSLLTVVPEVWQIIGRPGWANQPRQVRRDWFGQVRSARRGQLTCIGWAGPAKF